MTPLSDFRNQVAIHVIGCPDIVIYQAVLDSCIDFCQATNIVRETLDQIAVKASDFQIDLTSSNGTRIVQVQRAWIDGTELSPIQEDATGVFGYVQDVPGQTPPTGFPKVFSEESPGVIALYPRPDKDYTLTVRVSTKPSRSATAVNDVLYEDWVGVVASGALGTLMSMNQPWEDRKRAEMEKKLFKASIGEAIIESRRGRNRAEDRVSPVWV